MRHNKRERTELLLLAAVRSIAKRMEREAFRKRWSLVAFDAIAFRHYYRMMQPPDPRSVIRIEGA